MQKQSRNNEFFPRIPCQDLHCTKAFGFRSMNQEWMYLKNHIISATVSLLATQSIQNPISSDRSMRKVICHFFQGYDLSTFSTYVLKNLRKTQSLSYCLQPSWEKLRSRLVKVWRNKGSPEVLWPPLIEILSLSALLLVQQVPVNVVAPIGSPIASIKCDDLQLNRVLCSVMAVWVLGCIMLSAFLANLITILSFCFQWLGRHRTVKGNANLGWKASWHHPRRWNEGDAELLWNLSILARTKPEAQETGNVVNLANYVSSASVHPLAQCRAHRQALKTCCLSLFSNAPYYATN